MLELKTYRGHIRNWEALCETLSVDNVRPCSEADQLADPVSQDPGQGNYHLETER